jgi:hypothetical protein
MPMKVVGAGGLCGGLQDQRGCHRRLRQEAPSPAGRLLLTVVFRPLTRVMTWNEGPDGSLRKPVNAGSRWMRRCSGYRHGKAHTNRRGSTSARQRADSGHVLTRFLNGYRFGRRQCVDGGVVRRPRAHRSGSVSPTPMPRKPSGASFSAAAPRCGRRRRHYTRSWSATAGVMTSPRS